MPFKFLKVHTRILTATTKCFSTSPVTNTKYSCKLLVVGGGTGGCSTAAKFSRQLKKDELIVLEPSDYHYYQPLFTLIGGGVYNISEARRDEAKVLPKNCTWIKEKAVEFHPKNNKVIAGNGDEIVYEYMLIATGIDPNYEKIPGLLDALNIPDGKVCSIYSEKYVERTFKAMQNFTSGNAIFTFPNSPVKCPGAPQKICYLTEHYFRNVGKRDKAKIIYNTSLAVIFGVKKYAAALWKICEERNILVNTRTNLIEIRPDKDEAVFMNLDKPEEKTVLNYSMLHVTPPMSTAPELRGCADLVNQAGFVEVDKLTLQHIRFPNVFAIGDCTSTPNSKTAAAAAAQCEVVFKNLSCVMDSKSACLMYDGYASCPLVTGYNTCILAEFDYNLEPLETFPFSQDRELKSMYFMKKLAMPQLYWHLMLNGYWNGPAVMRQILHLGK